MKKKILFILHVPPPVHGSAIVGKTIMQSELINSKFQTQYIDLGTSKTLREIGKFPLKKLWIYLTILFKTVKSILTFKPNLIYIAINAKGVSFFKDAFVVFLAKLSGKKIVFHMHNHGVRFKQDNWVYNIFYRLVYKNVEVILLSELLYFDIEKYVPLEKVHICANGTADISKFVPAVESHSTTKKTEILFFSNLMRVKGVFVLLDACKILQQSKVSFRCTFIGGESDITAEDFNKKVAELDLGGYVRYAGRKYGLEKATAFSRSDIFAHPSLKDALPLVLVEALQLSLPIVSTYEGGIPDMVIDGETGFLVEKNNAQIVAEKLEILINDKELRLEMGKAGRNLYEENFTLSVFESRLSEILNKLA